MEIWFDDGSRLMVLQARWNVGMDSGREGRWQKGSAGRGQRSHYY